MACIAIDGKPTFGVIYRPFYNQTSKKIYELKNRNLSTGIGGLWFT